MERGLDVLVDSVGRGRTRLTIDNGAHARCYGLAVSAASAGNPPLLVKPHLPMKRESALQTALRKQGPASSPPRFDSLPISYHQIPPQAAWYHPTMDVATAAALREEELVAAARRQNILLGRFPPQPFPGAFGFDASSAMIQEQMAMGRMFQARAEAARFRVEAQFRAEMMAAQPQMPPPFMTANVMGSGCGAAAAYEAQCFAEARRMEFREARRMEFREAELFARRQTMMDAAAAAKGYGGMSMEAIATREAQRRDVLLREENSQAKARAMRIAMGLQPMVYKNEQEDTEGDGGEDEEDFYDGNYSKHHKVLIRRTQSSAWSDKFQELIEFKKRTGHSCVPRTFKQNMPLGRWVKLQRYQYKLRKEGKRSTLTERRIKALENIGFVWVPHAASWEDRLNDLKVFIHEKGHANVPSNDQVNPRLAAWVKRQRQLYKMLMNGEPSSLTVGQIWQLEDIGFQWAFARNIKEEPDAPPSSS